MVHVVLLFNHINMMLYEHRPSECFSYITNDNHRIEHYDCLPDDDYLNFKKRMQMESMPETAT